MLFNLYISILYIANIKYKIFQMQLFFEIFSGFLNNHLKWSYENSRQLNHIAVYVYFTIYLARHSLLHLY